MQAADVVIVGAGHGGVTAAALLRQHGFAGSIALLDNQSIVPYHRPILSKAWLSQPPALDTVLLRPRDFYIRERIELQLGASVSSVDRPARRVLLHGGAGIGYEHLILACGALARPVAVPGLDLEGVLSLRHMDEADRIRMALIPGRRMVILGGGYIGLEVAAAARDKGVEVVLLEREERLLARVGSIQISQYFASLHREHGVDLRLNSTLESIQGKGRVTGVRLGDGSTISCDSVLVAAGAIPADDLARSCGLACADGVIVDRQSRTSDSRIFAIGDMSRRPVRSHPAMRVESVASALEQARQAAWAILGRAEPAPEVPWFWSDQYGVKLQIAGIASGSDRTVVRRHERGFSVFHLLEGRVRCVEAVGSAMDFMGGKLLIGSADTVDEHKLSDASITLKTIVASAHAEA